MLWQPGALRDSRRRLDPFWNVVVRGLGRRESHDKEREREHLYLLIYVKNICVKVTERHIICMVSRVFSGCFCPPPIIGSTYTSHWMHVCGWIIPNQNILHPHLFILIGGRSYFSGIWDHEFYECSETRTHMIPPENREREWWIQLNSQDQSQTPGFYSEGGSKYWNT